MAGAITLLPGFFTGVLEEALERFLALDPNSPAYLEPLAGKVIALRVTPFDYHIYLCPTRRGVQLLERIAGEPDAILSGSPLAFARMGLSESPRRALFAGDIKIEGDVETARRFQSLFEKLEIDWEAQLARYTGQTLADRVVGLLRSGHAWRQEVLENLRLDIGEYLQEESRELPASAEADIFYREVDALRADYDRLEARIDRLKVALGASSPEDRANHPERTA
jgi:ubiquinone biosynthesis protein UbiJ